MTTALEVEAEEVSMITIDLVNSKGLFGILNLYSFKKNRKQFNLEVS